MKLTVLGSGTFQAHPERGKAGYLLSIGKENILIDAGSGVFDRLAQTKCDYKKINYIFITHAHVDHVLDLVSFLFAYYVNTYYNVFKKNLEIIAPPDFKNFYQDLSKPFPFIKKLNYVKHTKVGNSNIRRGFGSIRTRVLEHSDNKISVGYKFNHKNKSVVFAGDLEPCESIIDLSKNADVLVIESTVPKEMDGHLTPAQAGEIAQKSGVKKLVLTHFLPEVEKIDIKKAARKYYKGPIVLARDFMEIKI